MPGSLPGSLHIGAVIYVGNLARMTAFYEAVTQFDAVEREADHVTLQGDGVELVLVRMPDPIAATVTVTSPPAARESTPIKLMFLVESIAEARHAASHFGCELQDPEREWTFGDYRMCDGVDPEGNVFQVRERLQ